MIFQKRSLQEGFRLESWRCNLSHELGFGIPKPVLPDRERSRQEFERLTSTLPDYAATVAGKG